MKKVDLNFGNRNAGHTVTDGSGHLRTFLASKREEQQADIRLRVMRLLSQNPQMSTRRLADLVGISNGSAYYILTALIEKGFVKLGNFTTSSNKRQYAYLLTPKGIREKSILAQSFIKRKRHEFEQLKIEIATLEEEVGITNEVSQSNQLEKY